MVKKHKKKRYSNTTVVSTILLFLFSLFPLLTNRVVIGIYFAVRSDQTQIVTSQCVSVTAEELHKWQRHPCTYYVLHLQSGDQLALESDALDESPFRSMKISDGKQFLQECFVTGQDITFTYVRDPELKEGICALVSATDDATILDESTCISFYKEKTILTFCAVGFLWLFVLVIVLVPLIWHLHEKHLKRKKHKSDSNRQIQTRLRIEPHSPEVRLQFCHDCVMIPTR